MKIVAVDIGGTSIKAVIWENEVLNEVKEWDTDAKKGAQHVMKNVINMINSYKGFERIGISTAGQVDSEQGVIRYANENIPGYTGMPIKKILTEHFKVPVVVENDVNAAAIGEASFGAGREYKDFLCMTYGTGIGGAIVMNRQLYKGIAFSAGEFGSMITHAEHRQEGDLLGGCYERYASARALIEKAKLYDPSITNGRKLFERIDEADIQEIIDQWMNEVVYGLTNIIHIFNPGCIILGGGILEQKYILGQLNNKVYKSIMPSYRDIVLKQAELGNKAGLLGAIHLATTMK